MLGESKDWHHMMLFFSFNINSVYLLYYFDFHTVWIRLSSIWIKKDISLSLFTQSWRSKLFFFFFLLCGAKDAHSPTEHSCFHPWILSIIDGTPTASQAGIAWKKKTWKTRRNPASPRAPHRRQGSAWPPISTSDSQSLAGCDCLETCSKTDTHTHTDRHLWRATDLLP